MDNQNSKQLTPENPQIPPETPKSKPRIPILIASGILGVVVILMAAAYFVLPKFNQEAVEKTQTEDVNKTSEETSKPSATTVSNFATYKEVSVNISPKIPAYSINKNLNNVLNAQDFDYLSVEAKNRLEKNAFVVTKGYQDEFFPLYESNRYSYTPNFITTDSMLHNYHLMFDFLLRQLEELKLATELKQLNTNMLADSLNQYNSLKGT